MNFVVAFHFQQLSNSYVVKEILTVRNSHFSAELGKPQNQNYTSKLAIYTGITDFLSINFTCKSIDNLESESIHIFVRSNSEVENQGMTILVPRGDFSTKPVVLPCRPYSTSPNITVRLERQFWNPRTNISRWQIIHKRFLNFDPKIGITFIDSHFQYKNGLFKCTVTDTEYDDGDSTASFVYFNVTTLTGLSLQNFNFIKPYMLH